MFKITTCASIAILSTLMFDTGQADAGVIFNNGGPTGNGRVSDASNLFQTADDFTLTSTATIRSMTVYFFKFGTGPAETPLDFIVEFYNTASPNLAASNALFSTTSDGSVWGTDSGVNFIDNDIYEYTFNLANELTLGPGQYYVSPIVSGGNTMTHYWASTRAGGGGMENFRSMLNSSWGQGSQEHAFSLSSDRIGGVVPEPSSIAVWSFALAGVIAAFRRR